MINHKYCGLIIFFSFVEIESFGMNFDPAPTQEKNTITQLIKTDI